MGISIFAGRSSARPGTVNPAAATLVGVAFVTLAIWAVAGPMGHFSIDEGLYHFMTRAFAEEGRLAIWNGYTEYPSSQFILTFMRVHDGQIFPQYPSFYAVIAAPFYGLFGYDGLILLNALAYIGSLALCVALAHALFGDRKLSLISGLIYVFATFSWEYSQAAWPHATTALIALAAVYLTVRSLKADTPGRAALVAACAGLIAGFGAGVRLDVIFIVPAITIPFLFANPCRPVAAICAGLGTLPGLAVLAWTNFHKFGVPSPFSYGAAKEASNVQFTTYLPLVAVGVAALIVIWCATRPRARALLAERKARNVAVLSAIGVAILAAVLGWQTLVRCLDGMYQLLVDMRVRDLAIEEGGLTRGPGGGMVYIGNLKKSLLQSCPYLVVLAVPLIQLVRGGANAHRLAILFLVPAAFIGVYSYFAWHGGQALNLRYFVPILPFTSILAAYAWRETFVADPKIRQVVRVLLTAILVAVGVAYLVTDIEPDKVSHFQEFILLTVPLCIAFSLLALTLLAARTWDRGDDTARWIRSSATAAFLCGMIWSGTFAFAYDAPASFAVRKARAQIAEEAAPLISPDSLLIQAGNPDTMFRLIDKPKVRLAVVQPGNLGEMKELVQHHLAAGRPVYFWIEFLGPLPDWLLNSVAPLTFEPMGEFGLGKLYRMTQPGGPTPVRAPTATR